MRRNHLPTVTMPSLRTNRRTDPANSGLFVLFQEISGSIRLRGGGGSHLRVGLWLEQVANFDRNWAILTEMSRR